MVKENPVKMAPLQVSQSCTGYYENWNLQKDSTTADNKNYDQNLPEFFRRSFNGQQSNNHFGNDYHNNPPLANSHRKIMFQFAKAIYL